eukprot:TRINITY_DN18241_c0_g1_i1.p2 TRINITY_DN18241_c0_g1~~TRINITY_DN18241_c0_g1_i1.p2  ORF type:complete len:127 (-),score=49.97 TRINITY_DN18241_c0_g1_i1:34-357(-)
MCIRDSCVDTTAYQRRVHGLDLSTSSTRLRVVEFSDSRVDDIVQFHDLEDPAESLIIFYRNMDSRVLSLDKKPLGRKPAKIISGKSEEGQMKKAVYFTKLNLSLIHI